MRLFVGIPLADSVVRELAGVVERLRGKQGGLWHISDELRWAEPESWHITLQFLGNATTEQMECLNARLVKVRGAPMHLQVGELGCFDRTGVLIAGVVVTRELVALQESVVTATSGCGFVPETRSFLPHVTLARKAGHKGAGKQGNKLRELMAQAQKPSGFTRFVATEFVLYESHLGAAAARYEIRRRFPLTRV